MAAAPDAVTIPIGARSAELDTTTGVARNDQNGAILLEAVRARQRSDSRHDIVWSTLRSKDRQK